MTRTLMQPPASSETHAANGTATLAVACQSVVKDFGDGESMVHALRGIEMRIYRGEMTLRRPLEPLPDSKSW